MLYITSQPFLVHTSVEADRVYWSKNQTPDDKQACEVRSPLLAPQCLMPLYISVYQIMGKKKKNGSPKSNLISY